MFPIGKKYREIIYFKAASGLKSEASTTYLSFLWWVIDPLILLSVYYLVFGVFLDRGTDNFVPFLLIGLVSWQWFANTVTHSSPSVEGPKQLIYQIPFPKIILPSVHIAIDTVKFSVVFLLLIFFLLYYGLVPSIHYLALPLIVVTQYLFTMLCAYLAALLIPFIPDLKHVIPYALRAGLFLSGVFYAVDQLPLEVQPYFYWNPIAILIESYRDVFLHNSWPDTFYLSILFMVSGLGISVVANVYRRMDPLIPRTLMQQ